MLRSSLRKTAKTARQRELCAPLSPAELPALILGTAVCIGSLILPHDYNAVLLLIKVPLTTITMNVYLASDHNTVLSLTPSDARRLIIKLYVPSLCVRLGYSAPSSKLWLVRFAMLSLSA